MEYYINSAEIFRPPHDTTESRLLSETSSAQPIVRERRRLFIIYLALKACLALPRRGKISIEK